MTKKSLCVVTGTRAEYGLLRPVLQKLLQSDVIEPRLVVTGAHLAPEFGNTVSEIEADGMPIAARIPILKFGTGSPLATARTVSYTMERFTDYFSQNRPDAVLVLGDRYEIFAAGAAAALLEIPLAHISGGDVTAGAADDWFRHCLTKMASLHFPSCEVYARRLIRMGEDPAAVENVGGLGDENLRSLPLLSRAALAESIGFGLDRPYALVTYHPETAGGASPAAQFDALCAALERCGLADVFTKANADAGGADINARIDAVCAARPGQYVAFTSMGVLRYLSAMKYCAVVAGNSSSGVVETPSLGVPCVNVGDRQKGRLLSANIICCAADEASVYAALQKALYPPLPRRPGKRKALTTAATPAGASCGGWRRSCRARRLESPSCFTTAPCRGGKRRAADERIGGFLPRDVENGADGAGTAEHLGARLLGRRAGYSPARGAHGAASVCGGAAGAACAAGFRAAKAPAAHPRFRRDAGRGAGTVRLGLFSRMDGGGINGTPRGGGPVKGSMRGLLPEAIHRY